MERSKDHCLVLAFLSHGCCSAFRCDATGCVHEVSWIRSWGWVGVGPYVELCVGVDGVGVAVDTYSSSDACCKVLGSRNSGVLPPSSDFSRVLNVVNLFDFCIDDGVPYSVSRYSS